MTPDTYYIIDSSSLIELNRKYPIDIFPSLWKNMEGLIKNGFLLSHEEVFKEIIEGDDELAGWAKRHRRLFKGYDEKQMETVREILLKYPSLAKADNEKASADPFLIAMAVGFLNDKQQTLDGSRKGKLIVTEEKLRGNRVRIPFVCKDYGIDCIEVLEMCRREGWKF